MQEKTPLERFEIALSACTNIIDESFNQFSSGKRYTAKWIELMSWMYRNAITHSLIQTAIRVSVTFSTKAVAVSSTPGEVIMAVS